MARVIETIGTKEFEHTFGAWLRLNSETDSYHAFEFGKALPKSIAMVLHKVDLDQTRVRDWLKRMRWDTDPVVAQACQSLNQTETTIVRVDATALPAGYLLDLFKRLQMRERITIYGARKGLGLGIEISHDEGQGVFSQSAMAWLQDSADVMLSMLSRHVEITQRFPSQRRLASPQQIEEVIAKTSATAFPAREMQVCARTLYGLSTSAIALDLGVGEETIVTYRKRIYQRLGIATQRELLRWYLAL